MRKHYSMLLTALIALTMVLTACSGEKQALAPLDSEAQVKLKVVYYDENQFFQEYGNYFTMKFPNIDFEVISSQEMYKDLREKETYNPDDYEKAFKDFNEKHQPDIYMLDMKQYEDMAKDGKLYGLDEVIKQDKFDIENILPAVTQLLTEKGGGKIYGLTSSFSSNALYYNADLFKKHGIELPKNKMTWQETLALARRFPTEGSGKDRVYGFYTDGYNLANLVTTIGSTENLRIVDKDAKKVQFDSDNWKRAYQLVVDTLKSGAVYKEDSRDSNASGGMSMESYYERKPFMMGRAAMALGGSWMIQEMRQVKDQVKDFKPFEWGVVTVPVNPADPDTSDSFYLHEILAVNSKSSSPRAAWEFVKFVNGAEMAKMQSRKMYGNFPTRKEYIKDKDGHNLEAFYLLRPKSNDSGMWANVPGNFFGEYLGLLEAQTKLVLENKQTVDQAISNVQQQGQKALDDARAKEEAEKKKKKETK